MNNLDSIVQRIRDKIDLLKSLDSTHSIFGSEKHLYQLYPVLEEKTILKFEQDYKIKFPNEYKMFLTKIGNGGVGPYYGLEPFEHILYDDLDEFNEQSINPSLPFPYKEAWNLDFDNMDEDEYDEKRDGYYFEPQHTFGLIRICNYGCGVFFNLVVNGSEYGNIWIDDRISDGGLSPLKKELKYDRISFLDWYEEWLDDSIEEVKLKSLPTNSISQNDSFWDKIKNKFFNTPQ